MVVEVPRDVEDAPEEAGVGGKRNRKEREREREIERKRERERESQRARDSHRGRSGGATWRFIRMPSWRLESGGV